jgi:hypothetical protein
MKLRKVVSGGQTGADFTGLICAHALGLETGGTAPKGYRTETGANLQLKDLGLVESPDWNYQTRTRDNVRDADITVWFGKTDSPGCKCTLNAAVQLDKPFSINPTPIMFKQLAECYEVINIAGNRASKNPKVISQVQKAFAALVEESHE